MLERNNSYYLEYKSNTSRLSKRLVQKRLGKAGRNLDKFLLISKDFLGERQQLELTVYKHNLRANLCSLKQDYSNAKISSKFVIDILEDIKNSTSLFERNFIQEILLHAEQIFRISCF